MTQMNIVHWVCVCKLYAQAFYSYLYHQRDDCTRGELFQQSVSVSGSLYHMSPGCLSNQLHPESEPRIHKTVNSLCLIICFGTLCSLRCQIPCHGSAVSACYQQHSGHVQLSSFHSGKKERDITSL